MSVPDSFFFNQAPWRRPLSIRAWQNEVDALQKAGVVPVDVNKETWSMIGLLP